MSQRSMHLNGSGGVVLPPFLPSLLLSSGCRSLLDHILQHVHLEHVMARSSAMNVASHPTLHGATNAATGRSEDVGTVF